MRKIVCTCCNQELDNEIERCPNCGKHEISVHLFVSDELKIDESIRGKLKQDGKKRPTKEFRYGADYSRNLQKNVDRTMNVDRENGKYYEKVVNRESGEVIHECSEDLKDHFGHGVTVK